MINKKQIIVSTVFALVLAPVFVGAQTAPAKPAPAKPASAPAGNQPDLTQGIDQMFAAFDTNKNKQLSLEEFKVGIVAQRRQMLIIERLQGIFKAADKNANGTLEIVEFNSLPGMQSAPAPKPAFATYDLNKDQKIEFREYIEFVGKMSTPPKK